MPCSISVSQSIYLSLSLSLSLSFCLSFKLEASEPDCTTKRQQRSWGLYRPSRKVATACCDQSLSRTRRTRRTCAGSAAHRFVLNLWMCRWVGASLGKPSCPLRVLSADPRKFLLAIQSKGEPCLTLSTPCSWHRPSVRSFSLAFAGARWSRVARGCWLPAGHLSEQAQLVAACRKRCHKYNKGLRTQFRPFSHKPTGARRAAGHWRSSWLLVV